MANDPDRYAALSKDWNMGPFYVLVDNNTGHVVNNEAGIIALHRRPNQTFFDNAKASGRTVRRATIQLVGDAVL